MRTIQSTLHATIYGRIWMPAAICSKHVNYDLTSRRDRLVPNRAGSLRHMLLDCLNDGDFQSCQFAPGAAINVKITSHYPGRKTKTIERWFDLGDFADAADLIGEECEDCTA